MLNDSQNRRSRYYQLSTDLAHINNEQLKALLGDDQGQTHGWGVNHTITVRKSKVFVKTVPVTDLEYAHPFATKNLYDLPTYYNYGVGSAGFGVWRELVTHIKTTNWVLLGACENFPLMYHWRIVPRSGGYSAIDMDRHERYVNYWNSNENIGQYMLDRMNAKYKLVLLLEHFPHVLDIWLEKNIAQVNKFIGELRDTITFLRKNGIIHFDAHFGNIVTEGETPYLTDFGLVLDKRFDLSESEQVFFKKNSYYDYGELLVCLGWLLRATFENLAETKKKKLMRKFGMSDDMTRQERNAFLLENVSALYEDEVMKLDKKLVDALLKYRDIIRLMQEFYADMQRNHQKDTNFRNAKLKRLLEETEFLPAR